MKRFYSRSTHCSVAVGILTLTIALSDSITVFTAVSHIPTTLDLKNIGHQKLTRDLKLAITILENIRRMECCPR